MPFIPVNVPKQEAQQGGFIPVDMSPLDPAQNSLGVKSSPVLGEQPKSQFKEKFKSGFKDLLAPTVGAGKGILSTLSGASELGQRGLRALTQPFTGEQREIQRPEALQRATTPVGTGEKIGFGAEQIAEFFVPGGAALKAQKSVAGAKAITKLPKFLQGAAKLGGRAAVEAGIFAGVTALQEGEINKNVKNSALIGAAFPIAGAGLKALSKPVRNLLTKKVPSRLINSLIKPASKEFKFGKNPGLAVAQEGIKANSLEGLSGKVIRKRNAIGKMIGDKVRKTTGITNLSDDINSTINKHVLHQTDDTVINQMNNVLDQLSNVKQPIMEAGKIRLKNIGQRNISQMSNVELHSFQKLIGKLTKWTGAPAEKEVNKMLSELYGKVGAKLEKVAGVKSLQRRYANLLGAEKSLENTIFKLQNKSLSNVGFGNIIGSGTVGALTGDTAGDRVLNAFIFAALGKAAGTTAVKSRVAKALAKQVVKRGTTFQRVFGAVAEKGSSKKGRALNQPSIR